MARKDRVKTGVTSARVKRNVTTGRQMNLRLTQIEATGLDRLTQALQKEMPNKTISKSRVLRAFMHLERDEPLIRRLARSIKENT